MSDQLMSVVPEYRERRITYTIDKGETAPIADQFLVTIGSKTLKPNSVYLVVSRREIRPTGARKVLHQLGQRKYELKVVLCPELKEQAGYNPHLGYCWVEGQEAAAFPCFWAERKKKTL